MLLTTVNSPDCQSTYSSSFETIFPSRFYRLKPFKLGRLYIQFRPTSFNPFALLSDFSTSGGEYPPSAENPPSTGNAVPVTKLEASLARNTDTPERSSGTPQRPCGVREATRS